MYRNRTATRIRKPAGHWPVTKLLLTSMVLCLSAAMIAQETRREQPTWWFGASAAANLNFYGGTVQTLNEALVAPAAFHKGFGAGLYLGPMVEYRPDSVWGLMLHLAYDDRRGSFYDVPCPCGGMADLTATPSYISIEPSIRFAPFSDSWYIFGGPRIAFSWSPYSGEDKEFVYSEEGKAAAKGQFSSYNSTVYSGQIGIGYDIALTSPNDKNQYSLSPFISYQPWFGQEPRSAERWGISTVRVGATFKWGQGDAIPEPRAVVSRPAVVERDVQFTVQAPKAVPVKRRVRESFPLRDYVFFEVGSSEIPNRYVKLTKAEAVNFKEEQLQEVRPVSLVGRSTRQMTVYYNILNVIGDRLKRTPGTSIALSGASDKGPDHGKERAETVKTYLVDVFGIEGSRITTEGRLKPLAPSELRGATKELALLREGDSRVDITTESPELLIQVGGGPHYILKPVQVVAVVEDPLDGHVLFHVRGASEVLASWSLEISDEQGKVQRFGPSTRDHENLSGNVILGNRDRGTYKVVMLGQTKGGAFVRKEASVRLVRREEPKAETVRYSILFGFDESESVQNYQTFLTEIIAPLIPDSSLVIIHGYSDNIGDDEYNRSLSELRVEDTKKILEDALSAGGSKAITFETFGFGEDLLYARFDNRMPEGRFYNRSVVIDIVRDK